MINYEIGPLRAGDVEAVFQLERETCSAAHWPEEEYLQLVEPQAQRAVQRIACVAVQRGRVIGFIAGRLVLREAEIENIAVAPGFRRQGIAAALVESFLDISARRGTTVVRLEVRESNLAARRLYEACGFKADATRAAYYRNPEEGALLMSRRIRQGHFRRP